MVSNEWIVDVLVDTADTSAISVNLDADIAGLTPVVTPGVLDDVVLSTGRVVGTIADSEDSVINRGWAAISVGDDTVGVSSEYVVSSGDSHVDWLLGDSRLDAIAVVLHLNVANRSSDSYLSEGLILVASVSDTYVAVVSLALKAVSTALRSIQVIVSPEVPASIATLVAGILRAVNELLLRVLSHRTG